MRLIAIDTSTEYCSVALLNKEQVLVRGAHAPRQHAKLILAYVKALLAESEIGLQQLDGIIIGQGPGSFTGVRIAASMGQGLAFSQDLPVVGVSSLQALAQQAFRRYQVTHSLAMLDARMGELYLGHYKVEAGLAGLIGEEQTIIPEQVGELYQQHLKQYPKYAAQQGEPCGLVGTGLQAYPDLIEHHSNRALSQTRVYLDILYPQAEDMLSFGREHFIAGQGMAAEKFNINYVRNEVAWQKQPI